MNRLNKKKERNTFPQSQLLLSIRSHGLWSLAFFALTMVFHFIPLPGKLGLIPMVISWFFFCIIFGIFLGHSFLKLIKFTGNPHPKYSSGDLIVRLIMSVTFFVFFVGGLGLYSNLIG